MRAHVQLSVDAAACISVGTAGLRNTLMQAVCGVPGPACRPLSRAERCMC